METICIDISVLRVLLVQGRVAAMLRFFDSISNMLLLTIGDYYYHSHDKMVKRNGDRVGIWYGYWWV